MVSEAQTAQGESPRSGPVSAAALVGLLVACFSAAALGALFPPGDWYARLTKPDWNPPAWVFGPVWTVLYAAMAFAAWRVWRQAGGRGPWLLFAAQLLLNAAWSPLFFGLESPGLALAEILCLLVAVGATGVAFFRRDRVAGALFVPYFAWVAFASLLNAVLWRLNA